MPPRFVAIKSDPHALAPEPADVADALADLLYVVYGAGHAFGLDLDECFTEVHESNMSKFDKGKPIYREDGKVLKSDTYIPPNLGEILFPKGE